MHNATKLRAALKKPGALKVVGAHDALSARLIERAGFDGVWASGFAISASLKCIPDASFITSSEQLEVERNIAEAVNIPVIADCDTGYGNALNVMRTVNDRERAGVAAICIEDNVYPKRCSFYAGVRRELVPIEEHCGKIRAACARYGGSFRHSPCLRQRYTSQGTGAMSSCRMSGRITARAWCLRFWVLTGGY